MIDAVGPHHRLLDLHLAKLPQRSQILEFIHCTRCGRPSAGGKPYCHFHLFEMPYVQSLLQQIAAGSDVDDAGKPEPISHDYRMEEEGESEPKQRAPRRIYPLSVSERPRRALVILAERGPMPCAELSRLLEIHPSRTSSVIRALLLGGLITRTPAGLQRVIDITDLGRERLTQGGELKLTMTRRMSGRTTNSRRTTVDHAVPLQPKSAELGASWRVGLA